MYICMYVRINELAIYVDFHSMEYLPKHDIVLVLMNLSLICVFL